MSGTTFEKIRASNKRSPAVVSCMKLRTFRLANCAESMMACCCRGVKPAGIWAPQAHKHPRHTYHTRCSQQTVADENNYLSDG